MRVPLALISLLVAVTYARNKVDPVSRSATEPVSKAQNDFLYILPRARPDSLPEGTYCDNSLDIRQDVKKIFWAPGTPKAGKQAGNIILYSSRLEFPRTDDAFTQALHKEDKQLSKMAFNAYLEMDKMESNQKKRPSVMTAMAIGSRIYLSSSIHGPQAANLIVDTATWEWRDNIPAGLRDCLTQCQDFMASQGLPEAPFNPGNHQDVPDHIHRTRASCGECGALYQFFQDNPTRRDCDNAIFVTITGIDPFVNGKATEGFDKIEIVKKLRIVDPCKRVQDKNWGCDILTNTCKNSRAIKEDPDPRRFLETDYYIGPWKKTTKVGTQDEREEREPDADYRKSFRYFEKAFIPLEVGNLKATSKSN